LLNYLDEKTSMEQSFESYQNERSQINEKVVEYGHRLANSFHNKEKFAQCLDLKIQTSGRKKEYFETIA